LSSYIAGRIRRIPMRTDCGQFRRENKLASTRERWPRPCSLRPPMMPRSTMKRTWRRSRRFVQTHGLTSRSTRLSWRHVSSTRSPTSRHWSTMAWPACGHTTSWAVERAYAVSTRSSPPISSWPAGRWKWRLSGSLTTSERTTSLRQACPRPIESHSLRVLLHRKRLRRRCCTCHGHTHYAKALLFSSLLPTTHYLRRFVQFNADHRRGSWHGVRPVPAAARHCRCRLLCQSRGVWLWGAPRQQEPLRRVATEARGEGATPLYGLALATGQQQTTG